MDAFNPALPLVASGGAGTKVAAWWQGKYYTNIEKTDVLNADNYKANLTDQKGSIKLNTTQITNYLGGSTYPFNNQDLLKECDFCYANIRVHNYPQWRTSALLHIPTLMFGVTPALEIASRLPDEWFSKYGYSTTNADFGAFNLYYDSDQICLQPGDLSSTDVNKSPLSNIRQQIWVSLAFLKF